MALEVKVPSVGESVTEALLAQWYKEDGDKVSKDEPLFVIETDKVTLEVTAEADGVLHIKIPAGETVKIDEVVAEIDTESQPEQKATEKKDETTAAQKEAPQENGTDDQKRTERKPEQNTSEPAPTEEKEDKAPDRSNDESSQLSPSVRKLLEKNGLEAGDISGSGPAGRITRGDVLLHLERKGAGQNKGEPSARSSEPTAEASPEPDKSAADSPGEAVTRESMSPLRRRIAEHLLNAKQNTAMLTTFNDIDMQNVMQIRSRYKEAFKSKYDVSLGFMSFFIKACIEALRDFPRVNAFIEDGQIVYHHYFHIGVAIGTGKGLVVPVIRHADRLSFAELEQAIVAFVEKVKNNRLELADLEGGTFTITNGGVFGSLLSTPILNMPQSGILGMHRIEKRPVVVDDQIVIRPMMYVALSYDHRIIDGREAVTFLRRIKECVENPERTMMEI
jgi:2-oxoglutarate dehydrogenase E2 component (dihydrolipoamide succinyltransferase)